MRRRSYLRRSAALSALLGTLALLATTAPALAAGPGTPAGAISHHGRWFTDAHGRVVVLHGVNMVYKVRSYRPASAGFGSNDARFLRRHGFNSVRLGLIYAGLAPKPPTDGKARYAKGYLSSVARTQAMLGRRGIFSLIDFHQDLFNERFQGEGWPDWATIDDGVPSEVQAGFPASYVVNLGLQRAYDNFWNNKVVDGRGLQDAYDAALRHVAKRFRRRRHVLGYDMLNEPWPGSAAATCLSPLSCPVFDSTTLTDFSKGAIAQIRKVDRRKLAFYEPNLIFDFGARTFHGDTGDPNAGMSFHDYCLPAGVGVPLPGLGNACKVTEDLVFQNAEDQATANGDALFMTEFGSSNDDGTNERVAELADKHMVSWDVWHYCDCDDPTTALSGHQGIVIDAKKAPRGKNVNRVKLRALERPYPQVVAGTPRAWSFDPQTRIFKLRYSRRAPNGRVLRRRNLTSAYMPRARYGHGYRVRAKGARVVSKRNARHLLLKRKRRAKIVRVTVRPRA